MMQYALSSQIPRTTQQSIRSENLLDPDRLRRQADRNLYAVVRQNHIPQAVQDSAHASFLETPVGIATLLLARWVISPQHPSDREHEILLKALNKHWEASVHLLSGTLQKIVAEDQDDSVAGSGEDGGSEVLYGRAGFLYSLLYLRKAITKAKEKACFDLLDEDRKKDMDRITRDSSLKTVVDGLVRRGRAGARRYRSRAMVGDAGTQPDSLPPLMWRWHGKAYVGGAHGVRES